MSSRQSLSGGSLVAKSLAQEGVEYVFSLCGGHINPIYKALDEEGIQIITTRHEQAAGNAAEGYAITTRRPGVCLVTAGPGFTNLLPAMISAYYARSPVIALAGRAALCHIDKYANQEMDQIPLAKHVTKYAKMIHKTARIPEYIQEAFRVATSENMGPVLLDIPQDIQTLHWEPNDDDFFFDRKPEVYRVNGKTYPDPFLVKKATQLLLTAEKPVIIAGSGVYWGNASESLLRVAEFLSIPVAHDELGMGCIPGLHPLSIGSAIQNVLIRDADVILVLGVTFGELQGFGTNPNIYNRDVKVIWVDPDSKVIGKNRPFELGITSSITPFLTELLYALQKETNKNNLHREWSKLVKQKRLDLESILIGSTDSSDIPIKPQRLTKEIQPFLDKNTRLILDGGDTTVWALLILKSSYPGQIYMAHGPTGHLGAGIPHGIGSKLADPDRNVMILTGDGSFLFNGAEIDTAVRYDLPLVIIIENDSAWGMIAHNQDLSWGYRISSELNQKIDYVKFAESLGAQGELVTRPEDVSGAIKHARDSGSVALIDVRVDDKETNILNQRSAAAADPSYWQ
ncbi:MAG: thiamine pyrophosphate-binding protein [Candidatus Hodarchaeota archaeon]